MSPIVTLSLLALAAQAVPPPTQSAAPVTATPTPAETVSVVITTALGPITIVLAPDKAPATVANFLKYVDGKKLDGAVFYRSVKVADGYGLVQFGTRNDPKRTLPPVGHEPTSQTGLSHVDGAISMAMAAPGTAAGDFFIVVGDLPSMDAKPGDPGFAVFGKVTGGMDIVRQILLAPTSPTAGEGVMKGQMLEPTLPIASARRTN